MRLLDTLKEIVAFFTIIINNYYYSLFRSYLCLDVGALELFAQINTSENRKCVRSFGYRMLFMRAHFFFENLGWLFRSDEIPLLD